MQVMTVFPNHSERVYFLSLIPLPYSTEKNFPCTLKVEETYLIKSLNFPGDPLFYKNNYLLSEL